MKLRNKKTGEIVDLSIFGITLNTRKEQQPTYHSIEQLCEDWEDSKEPLIKDEKIRKAVRAWAEINDLYSVHYNENADGAGFDCRTSADELVQISFASIVLPLEKRNVYTIEELCGKEEE